ncbi:MAG: preprotein translocase, SecG subunit [Myxococcales bacterium]|nr:preprotein translocase, SecG subunit [Myxococcales bacterium]
MSTLITVLHVIVCLFLMLTVLLQSGKSGGMGAAFGGGNAATVFGGSGASTFLRKLTAGAATIFMITSMVLAFIASHNSADALEKFGESQAKLAADKESAKAKALEGAGSGSSDGSAGSAGPSMMMTPEVPGTTTGSAGDLPGNPGGGQSGSAVTPAETPVPAGATDGRSPASANPATPAGMSPAPADAKRPADSRIPPVSKPGADSTTKEDRPLTPPATETKPADTTKPAEQPPAATPPAPNSSSPNAPK